MITKIIVIAMGLVAIVPRGDNDGMTVLLRDALLATPRVTLDANPGECDVEGHVPLIVQLAGTCEGDCTFRLSQASTTQVLAGLTGQTLAGFDLQAFDNSLLWMPMHESLRFDGIVPAKEPAQHNLKHSYRLGGGGAQVKRDCLEDATECPLIGRLTVSTGSVHACSLAKNRGTTQNAGFLLEPLESTVDGNAIGVPLAEAYSVDIETNRRAPLVLTAANFSESMVLRTARLRPDAYGRIVLLVSNMPLKGAAGGDAATVADSCGKLQMGLTHAAALYDLVDGDWGAAARTVPHFVVKSSPPEIPIGGCELLTTTNAKLAVLGKMLDEYPSDPAQCKPGGVLNQ